jgi:DNA-binding NtrC family response regulator
VSRGVLPRLSLAMPETFVLVVEPDDSTAELLTRALEREGHRVERSADAGDLERLLRSKRFDLVLIDAPTANADGLDRLARVARYSPGSAVILLSAFSQPEAMLDAIAHGAADFLSRPVDVLALRAAVARALERRHLMQENQALRGEILGRKTLIGSSGPMLRLLDQIGRLAPTESPLLILGESGSGKGMVARALHEGSRRAAGPWVAVHCALEAGILEGELFGRAHRRGAFVEAGGGTLFLDQIGDTPERTRPRLARALEEMVSGDTPTQARLVATAEPSVSIGKLPLAGAALLQIPPLRERGDDILELSRHFIARHAAAFGRAVPELSPEAAACLQRYGWPGNVRELEGALARAVAVSAGSALTPADLPPSVLAATRERGANGLDADWPTLSVLQGRYIERVMERTGGNKTLAASVLGVDRRTLQRLFARTSAPRG